MDIPENSTIESASEANGIQISEIGEANEFLENNPSESIIENYLKPGLQSDILNEFAAQLTDKCVNLHVDEIDLSPKLSYCSDEDYITGLSNLPERSYNVGNKLIVFTLSSGNTKKQCVLSFDVRSNTSPRYVDDFNISLLRNIAACIENKLEIEAIILDKDSHLNSVLNKYVPPRSEQKIANILGQKIRIINDFYHIVTNILFRHRKDAPMKIFDTDLVEWKHIEEIENADSWRKTQEKKCFKLGLNNSFKKLGKSFKEEEVLEEIENLYNLEVSKELERRNHIASSNFVKVMAYFIEIYSKDLTVTFTMK